MNEIAHIFLENVNKHYGHFQALKDINLSIEKGTFVALVGPSGCGKSTLLRALAGLESISDGILCIDGQVMNDMPPRKRDLAMVFQSYALYPHMRVLDNLTYSMRLKRRPKAETQEAAENVADITGLAGLLERFPKELSGGQRQRVAMGRAIIRNPKAFLFDEPLSNLDAALRVHMRKEIRSLHNRLKATSVYVTHDQIEAMTMADHVVVMRSGSIEQQGAPLELYDRPANKFVAGFIGSPSMNFLPGIVTEDGAHLRLNLGEDYLLKLASKHQPGTSLIAGIRPERIKIVEQDQPGLSVDVTVVEHTGSSSLITTDTDPEMTIVEGGRSATKNGDKIKIHIAPDNIHLFDAVNEEAL